MRFPTKQSNKKMIAKKIATTTTKNKSHTNQPEQIQRNTSMAWQKLKHIR